MEFASSSSSFFPKSKTQYDVLIIFRGQDTRMNFVSHLYNALLGAGVNTFLDEENQLKNKQQKKIVPLIEGSQIRIVVFSETYSKSSWCLDELVKIIEWHETYGGTIMPIFYKIKPSDVRSQEGDFGKELKETAQKSFSEELLESGLLRWSYALTKASSLLGWVQSQYRNDADLVQNIVSFVITKLDSVMSITEFPVGLESHVKNVIGFIENRSNTVSIIGIWGMGGLGKTTTAKAIYNKIQHRFKDVSFIENIQEVCYEDPRGLTRLQEQLLLDVLKTKVKIDNVEMGRTMIQNKLFEKRMLIVLDDVSEFEQLNALRVSHQMIDQGTIIITTRDVHVLHQVKVDYVYEIKLMDSNESLELFCWHAFRDSKPREDFNELVRKVVAYCGGLPLAIEILGAHLNERPPIEWRSVLSKLERIPNYGVYSRLRASFDGLHEMEKNIFLDICCFFIGKDRGYVTEILNGCDLLANIGITNLIERSLIKIGKNNKLGMHNLLREMGREIIRKSSALEPEKRSRLWFRDDIFDVLTHNTGTNAIQGLALNLPISSKYCFNAYAFKQMKRLRLLKLEHVQLTGDYEYLPKELKWICWTGFPLKHIPDNFYLGSVIVIDFKYSNLRVMWKKTPKVLPRLKILNLSHSRYLAETPDFSNLPSLEKLILKSCSSLCKIHRSIGGLHNLQLINLKDCTSLSNLPRTIYKLKSLDTLILSGCSKIVKFEEDIVQLESLTTLIAEDTAVKQVASSIVRSKSYAYISLCGFEGLSRDVFPSIIRSWMLPTINPLSYIRPICGASSSLVSVVMHNNNLVNIAKYPRSLFNIRSVWVQCDTIVQLSKQLNKFLDDVDGANCTYTSQFSMQSLRTDLIGIGTYQEVFETLNSSISKGLATNEACDVLLPGDNHPHWFAHLGEGYSVNFTVPEDCRMKGMILCVVYLSTPDIMATECLTSVLIVNYTKCTIQIHKRETIVSFKDEDWKLIISHLEPGDKVEIFVSLGQRLVVKKTAVYLLCDKSIDKEIKSSAHEPKKETKKNGFVRFVKKIPILAIGIFLCLSFHSIKSRKSIL